MKKFINKKYILSVLYTLLFALVLTFIIEAITRNSLWSALSFLVHNPLKFTYNSSVVLLTLLPIFLFKRRYFAITIVSAFWLIFSIADNLIMKFRGTPLTGSDLFMIKDGFTLAGEYLSPVLITLIIIAIIALIGLLVWLFLKSPKVKVNYMLAIPLLLIFILFHPRVTSYLLSKNILSRNFWDVTINYGEYGFPYSFLNSVFKTGMEKPDNYSKEILVDLRNNLTSKAKSNRSPETKPNIILIQLESFIDINNIKDLSFSNNPVPNFTALKENYPHGLLKVPSSGGGTANTEFEILTSMNTDFFGVGEFPFNTVLLRNTVNSSGYYFKGLGYNTFAMHNHEASFYNRDKVYGNLGFDVFIPIESMPVAERTTTGWAKDNILIPEILQLLQYNSNPDFIYGISVQGHGPYPTEPVKSSKITVTKSFDSNVNNKLEYYANTINEMDAFVGNLIKEIDSLKEPSIIVFYGDHYPALGIPNDKITIGDVYTTEYVIWNNLNLENRTKDIETYELIPYLLDTISFPTTPLYNLHIANSESSESSESSDYKDNLYLIQYDVLYGKNFINNEAKNDPLPNYKIGFNSPSIKTIKDDGETLIIEGANFNEFSKVYIEDKAVETIFIDTKHLKLSASLISKSSPIQVKQISAKNSQELLSSNILK